MGSCCDVFVGSGEDCGFSLLLFVGFGVDVDDGEGEATVGLVEGKKSS